jgi:hypothetical protein
VRDQHERQDKQITLVPAKRHEALRLYQDAHQWIGTVLPWNVKPSDEPSAFTQLWVAASNDPYFLISGATHCLFCSSTEASRRKVANVND